MTDRARAAPPGTVAARFSGKRGQSTQTRLPTRDHNVLNLKGLNTMAADA